MTDQLDLFATRSAPRTEIGVVGATYVEHFLNDADCVELLRQIDAMPWRADLQRRVQHYGYRYDYKARRVTRDMYLGELPVFLRPIATRLTKPGYFKHVPDQAIVNEYQPGQGISKHVDCVPCFGDVIASVSLGSACEMEFENPENGETRQHLLRPGSLLVLAGEARYGWLHSIRARASDAGVPRRRRVSVTFRTVLLGQPTKNAERP